jgi:CTP synthase (UTP-ammonia lyase)
VRIVAIGDRDPRHLTHREVDAALELFPTDVDASWAATDSAGARDLGDAGGVWLLPGSPYRDDSAAFAAIRHCLETGTPFLGTCGGFQYACVELARSMAGVDGAAHAETAPEAEETVIEPLACELFGERRTVHPVAGTQLAEICGEKSFEGFHWCGYGLADGYSEVLREAGVVISATAEDAGVEAIELPEHDFFLATAFQPQVGATETGRLHPLLLAFLAAARTHSGHSKSSVPSGAT